MTAKTQRAALAAIIAFSFVLRLLVVDIPFERDEGEYAYAAQLLLDGVPPFKEAYNMKFPGIYAAYAALLFVFGQTHSGAHLGLAFVNAATVVLVFLIGKRLFEPAAALGAAAMFAMLSFLPSVQGIMANSEHFVLLAALGGTLVLMSGLDGRSLPKLLIGGFLLGAGYTIKQHGAAFVLFGCFLVVFRHARAGEPLKKTASGLLALLLGAAIPFALMCAILYISGVFDEFWFWTFSYAREYVTVTPLSIGLARLEGEAANIFLSAPLLWVLSALGLLFPLWEKKRPSSWLFIAGLLFFSCLAVVPGFFFRPHYFIYVLPAASLLFAGATTALPALFGKKGGLLTAALCVILAASFTFSQRSALASTPEELSREMYGYNPFPEALVIAEYISRNTAPGDRIAVLGSEPEIYFYSRRRAATGFMYTYALMERQRFALEMQKKMMAEVRRSNPAYVVFVDIKFSWGANEDSHLDIFGWLKDFVAERYTLAGMVDLKAPQTSKYSWDKQIETAPAPEPGYGIYIYRRD